MTKQTTQKKSYPNERDCKHGSMRGKCDICEYEQDISELESTILELRKEVERLKQQNNKLKMPIELGERNIFTRSQLAIRDLEMQAKGTVDSCNNALQKITIPKMSGLRAEYFKAGITAFSYSLGKEAETLRNQAKGGDV